GRLGCRFRLKGARAGTTAVSLVLRYPGRGEITVGRVPLAVTPEWKEHETAFFNFLPGQKPQSARIEVLPPAGSAVWLRDLRLEHTASRPASPEVEVMRPRPVELPVEPVATLAGHVGPVTAVAPSPRGLTLATG